MRLFYLLMFTIVVVVVAVIVFLNVEYAEAATCSELGGVCTTPVGGGCPPLNGEAVTHLQVADDDCRERNPTQICCGVA